MPVITGKTCVVTGGNRGIGLELTRQLAAKGNTVFVTARNPSSAVELQKLAALKDTNVQIHRLDITDESSIHSFTNELLNESSISHVDLLINNAGAFASSDFFDLTAEEMTRLFMINAVGPVLTTQAFYKSGLLGRAEDSVVANITSRMGSFQSDDNGGLFSYKMTKAALNSATMTMSRDLESVACVLLHPGFVKTDMTGGSGDIDAKTCASGLLKVLETGGGSAASLNGKWFDYRGEEIPW